MFNQFYKEARKKFSSDRQLSIAIGVQPQNFLKYKKGQLSPTVDTLKKWCDLTKINWDSKFYHIN